MTPEPLSPGIPLCWSDGTWAVVRTLDLPEGVMRLAARGSVELACITTPENNLLRKHKLDTADAGLNSYAKVRIADLVAIKPKEQLYDGLTAAQCLQRYTENMQNDAKNSSGGWAMTNMQKSIARNEWRAALLVKKTETAIKERDQVRVDLEYDAWE